MFVNEIEVMYERPLVNVKVERGSTFTYTRDVPYIVSVFFYPRKMYVLTHVKNGIWGNQGGHCISWNYIE